MTKLITAIKTMPDDVRADFLSFAQDIASLVAILAFVAAIAGALIGTH